MRLQMLGTGSAFAKRYYNNNALLTTEGKTLMVDCGITAPRALHELGMTFNDIDALLITHIHADHVGGMEEYAFQMKFVYRRKPVLYAEQTLIEPLWNRCLRGGLEQDGLHRLEDYFEVRPLAAGHPSELLPGLKAELLQTRHIPNKPSYSILFNDHFFYTSDMIFDRELLERLVKERGVNVIFHDCQLQPPGEVHADLNMLLTLPEELQRMIYLMHYGDDQPSFARRTGNMTFVEQHKIYGISNGRVELLNEIR